jgi:hypothetical protein
VFAAWCQAKQLSQPPALFLHVLISGEQILKYAQGHQAQAVHTTEQN